MRNPFLKLHAKQHVFWGAIKEESALQPAEYMAVLMIVALGLTAGVATLANGVNSAMSYAVAQVSAMASGSSQINGGAH